MHQDGEASVEEILESIKKVIARDNRTSAETERKKRARSGVEPEEENPATDNSDDDVLDLGSAAFFEEEIDSEDDLDRPLIGDAVRASMQENLAALAMLSEPSTPPQIVRSGETSLEGMVREMLRPMLAEWLDQNLPEMVESMVRSEINRIAGKRG